MGTWYHRVVLHCHCHPHSHHAVCCHLLAIRIHFPPCKRWGKVFGSSWASGLPLVVLIHALVVPLFLLSLPSSSLLAALCCSSSLSSSPRPCPWFIVVPVPVVVVVVLVLGVFVVLCRPPTPPSLVRSSGVWRVLGRQHRQQF